MQTETSNITAIAEPAILAANTYFWSSATSAGSRRRNEERHQATVADYLTALGFDVERSGDNVSGTHPTGVAVRFAYSESCHNVYKQLGVTNAKGGNSNITAIRKIAAAAEFTARGGIK